MRLFRFAAAIGLTTIVLSLSLTGCAGFFQAVTSTPTGNGTSFAYIIHSGGTLAEYSLTDGVLAALSGSPLTLPVTPTAIAVSPNNAFVFVGTATGVFLYTTNSDGTLTEGNSDAIIYLNQTITTPVIRSMVVDPTSSWLLIAYQGNTNSTYVDALPIDPTSGLPTAAQAQTVQIQFGTPSPSLAISPTNTQVFVTIGTGGTEAFVFDHTQTTGNPWVSSSLIPLKSANTSDTGVSVDPSSTYLFITEASTSTTATAGTVRMIATAKLGTANATPTEPSDLATGVGPSAALADLSGQYVYVTNQNDATISAYSYTKTNPMLTSLGTSPTAVSPIAIMEDHSKAFIMTIGSNTNPNLWLYNFDTTTAGVLNIKTTTSTASVSPALANGLAVTY
jgi:6-phosphogluconolactonase (cycloisomerase 2 family)